ncbi:MAG: nickel pincer cofactor biosynthesis protein LarB [Gemmatimonadetes bacterium]|jgi:NCAIR mutase (PurE)-related protein|nr:nickel pincer cofactor biosynthesis protein LarB [Gemmatimonadota bacterium]MBT5804803.1 nickel pincer cofactor biosynthesis protein LarB [Gemmatimonadota bacterium]MBT6623706.1 nickel pincer cofactor biosynthesis protein LarB [Gemmatimonadota bacterium]MBT6902957.1 nickel pincer cofactor biosynthesis protein LarB [Gemmatimonadota bacterium]MBT7549462.1 nickel pincer cofactor biosynthesis protein LarB [Gemmatimonadota bacterium]
MNQEQIRQLLEQVASGNLEPDKALEQLRDLPFENLGFAHIDHHRALRTGFPEVIFGQGKTREQIVSIAERIIEHGSQMLATRLAEDAAQALVERFPQAEYDTLARTVLVPAPQTPPQTGLVAVVSAGTSDLPVAREAVVTAQAMGAHVEEIYDVGVAGLHRLLAYREQLQKARVIVVVAGMEGALASVVGGLVDIPVVAVPTSVGYGASFQGVAALLAMLNSCASGVVVVNIDNGFGAGYAAALINRGAGDGT